MPACSRVVDLWTPSDHCCAGVDYGLANVTSDDRHLVRQASQDAPPPPLCMRCRLGVRTAVFPSFASRICARRRPAKTTSRRRDGCGPEDRTGTTMSQADNRVQGWVLELSSVDGVQLEDATGRPATPTADSISLPRWSSEIQPGEGSPPTRITSRSPSASASASRAPSTRAAPLPGAADFLPFQRTRGGLLAPVRQARLRNNRLAAVGFLEAANAGDFAANVWNETPVPAHALALMALGGALALGMLVFAARDARLSWANLRALRAERAYLRRQRAAAARLRQTVECLLDRNAREAGAELVDRLAMDVLLGLGALLVALGTFLAMDGDPGGARARASTVLTGYVGNAPCALFGVANLAWSGCVWARARRQQRAARRYGAATTTTPPALRARAAGLQVHAALSGATGAVAGAAALATATAWWGYVVLVPCVVTAGVANLFWRRRLGYERPLVTGRVEAVDAAGVVAALRAADACRRRVLAGRAAGAKDAFAVLVADPGSLMDALDVIRGSDLFEDYCARLLADRELSRTFFLSLGADLVDMPTVDWQRLAASADAAMTARLLVVARACINELALTSFIYQERHLLELLGCYLCRGAEFGHRRPRRPSAVKQAPTPRNVNS